MPMIRIIFCILLCANAATAQAADGDDDWISFGRVLSVVQSLVRLTASSDDPKAVEKGVQDMLAGRDNNVNRLLADVLEDMPAEQRGTLMSIGRDLAAIAARDKARTIPQQEQTLRTERALDARKTLTQMGLRYHHPGDYLAAVKRDDVLAVELFLLGKGVNPAARDESGDSAIDIARRNGNAPMVRLLAGNGKP